MNYYHVVSRKFCCCLPVRIGVFVLSLLSALFGAVNAYVAWYVVVRTAKYGTVDESMSTLNNLNSTNLNNANITSLSDFNTQLNGVALDKTQYYIFIVTGVIFTLYALFSLFGFIGTVMKNRALVAWYSTLLWFLLILNAISGGYSCYSVIKQRKTLSDQCASETANTQSNLISNEENKLTSAACSAASKVGVALVFIIVIIELLLQLYACIIVKRYVEQLSEEQAFKHHSAGNRISKGSSSGGSYYPHQPLMSDQHELGPYPYNQADHSFGAKA